MFAFSLAMYIMVIYVFKNIFHLSLKFSLSVTIVLVVSLCLRVYMCVFTLANVNSR